VHWSATLGRHCAADVRLEVRRRSGARDEPLHSPGSRAVVWAEPRRPVVVQEWRQRQRGAREQNREWRCAAVRRGWKDVRLHQARRVALGLQAGEVDLLPWVAVRQGDLRQPGERWPAARRRAGVRRREPEHRVLARRRDSPRCLSAALRGRPIALLPGMHPWVNGWVSVGTFAPSKRQPEQQEGA
jgi:hypothetical protein